MPSAPLRRPQSDGASMPPGPAARISPCLPVFVMISTRESASICASDQAGMAGSGLGLTLKGAPDAVEAAIRSVDRCL